ncbi:hypothetical protein EON66_08830, partial [archaeon]
MVLTWLLRAETAAVVAYSVWNACGRAAAATVPPSLARTQLNTPGTEEAKAAARDLLRCCAGTDNAEEGDVAAHAASGPGEAAPTVAPHLEPAVRRAPPHAFSAA